MNLRAAEHVQVFPWFDLGSSGFLLEKLNRSKISFRWNDMVPLRFFGDINENLFGAQTPCDVIKPERGRG